MKSSKYHSITDIVASVYCEQKLLFDREHGDARPVTVRAKAVHGTADHLRFELEGNVKQAVDRRCFISSAVFGGDAAETEFLRLWRDRFLVPSLPGRLAIQAYYAISPALSNIVVRSRYLKAAVRNALLLLLLLLGFRR